jgi:hypothetical protein
MSGFCRLAVRAAGGVKGDGPSRETYPVGSVDVDEANSGSEPGLARGEEIRDVRGNERRREEEVRINMVEDR